ncbi:ectonucleoside triphosphate diphosphohydrolase 5-like [Leptopilina heterotoma]|uniref:ectonucleoside triphosphate diphosphohydrolase 5-like n=1 Tax=Leptopilina heterotoma TaxID=63436 RepID=UPI001CA862C9|nr:ectonucleoside triphosphate diphosphohydrolase 5-like [Leptopilina heterotoma]
MSALKGKLRLDGDDHNIRRFDIISRSTNQRDVSKTILKQYTLLFLGFVLSSHVAFANGSTLPPVEETTTLDSQKPLYAVIIDAGSTGSRVFAFRFRTSTENGSPVLESELFHQEKPGLSSYADNPIEATKSLGILVEKAKSAIPSSEWGDTPLLLKATAGLRLLPADKANRILEVTRNFLNSSGFQLNENSVSIMEGVDEGIFSWVTANFLLGRFSQQGTQSLVAVIDLGGGSTQVTYRPNEENIKALNHSIHNISVFNQKMSVFTHSYLGMGLMAARKAILVPKSAAKNENGIVVVHSKCFDPLANAAWKYGSQDYEVMGSAENAPEVDQNSTKDGDKSSSNKFEDCLNLVKNYTNTIENRPVGLNKEDIFAFAYYFDRTSEVGLIDRKMGGKITLEDIHKTALEACNIGNREQPFMCLDLTYIYSLLTDVYGLNPENNLQISDSISGHQLNWALGLALNMLQSKF